MKQADKVIRRGDYYQMEVVEDGLYSMKTYKKEEISSHIQPSPDNLITDLPPFNDARANYYFEPVSTYSNAEPDLLLHELENILASEKLADSDKQEILKLIREIKILKEQPLVPLVELTPSSKTKEKQPTTLGEIDLKVKVELSELEKKLAELEAFSYPELNSYEHQLQVLLGEKKIASVAQLPKDSRNKQEIDQLFAQCSNITCASNLSGIVDRIHANSPKHEEMLRWTQRLEQTTSLHFDFLAELNEDEQLLNRLQSNFEKNVRTIRQTIEKIKKEASR